MRPALALLWTAAAAAQSLQVYSEFQRPDPFGNILPVDKAESPREILSPALPRNAWASFHLSVAVPEGMPAFLYIQQNPEILRVEVYRERFVKTAAGWIPDTLEAVKLPYYFILPDAQEMIPGQSVVNFWLDIWVPAEVPPERMRLQALLKAGDRWLVYPLELRIRPVVVPAFEWKPGAVPPVTARADASLAEAWCGKPVGDTGPLTVRQLVRRNGLRDKLLTEEVPAEVTKWCQDPGALPPEWYLRVRDRLFR